MISDARAPRAARFPATLRALPARSWDADSLVLSEPPSRAATPLTGEPSEEPEPPFAKEDERDQRASFYNLHWLQRR